jgi:hypothetical protein
MSKQENLAESHPHLAAEALIDLTAVSRGSNKKVPWRCAQGHEWEAKVANRVLGHGCPYCAGQRAVPGVNDLATLYPELAKEALFDATKVMPGSHKKGMWRCVHGHEWETAIGHRVSGRGCPFCSGNRVLPGFNDLATVYPELAKEALFDATKVTFGSGSKGTWRCTKGHEWEASVNDRAQGRACPFCSGNRVLPGFNDLASTDPDLSTEALFDPTTVSRGSGKKVTWRCVIGHEWEASPSTRSSQGVGCPFCSGQRVFAGFNDLATLYPELAKEALFDATKVTAGSGRKEKWRCAEGHEWRAVIGSRTSETGGRGCPNCAVSGFHPERRAWLYLMYHDRWEMLQIGITNNPAIRERQHRRDGWTLVDIRGPMDGVLTQSLERDILKFLKREVKVKLSTSRRSQYEGRPGQKGGEAWPIDQYRIESLSVLLDAVTEWEGP